MLNWVLNTHLKIVLGMDHILFKCGLLNLMSNKSSFIKDETAQKGKHKVSQFVVFGKIIEV